MPHHRWAEEDMLDEMERRVQEDPEKMRLRKRLAEHSFGTIKHHWGQSFLTRKFPSVSAEIALMFIAYNIIQRVIKILGVRNTTGALA
jgi:hypothetical protein